MAIDKPLTRVNFIGDIAYGDVRVKVPSGVKKRLAYRSPLVFMAGKGGDYDGDKSENAAEVRFKTISVSTPTVRFEEFDVQQPQSGTAQSDSDAGSTTLDVGTTVAPYLRPQDVLHFPVTGMNVRVVSVTSPIDGTLTIERAVGSSVTTPATVYPAGFTRFTDVDIPSAAQFIVIAPAVVQHSTARVSRQYNALTIREASTQIIRDDLKISRTRLTQQSTNVAKQVAWEERRMQSLNYVTAEIEKMILFGNALASTGGRINATGSSISTALDSEGNEYTTSDGIFAVMTKYASANIYAANATEFGSGTVFTRAKANVLAEMLQALGGGHVILCSKTLLNSINSVLTDPTVVHPQVSDDGSQKMAGNAVLSFQTIWGKLQFQHHPLFDLSTKYISTMLCIKPDNIGLLGLKGAELTWKDGAEENDRDGKAGYYLAELGLAMAYASEAVIVNAWTFS